MPLREDPNKHLLDDKAPQVDQKCDQDVPHDILKEALKHGRIEPGYYLDETGNIVFTELSVITNFRPCPPTYWLSTPSDKYIRFYYLTRTQEFCWEVGEEKDVIPQNGEVIGTIDSDNSITFYDTKRLQDVIKHGE